MTADDYSDSDFGAITFDLVYFRHLKQIRIGKSRTEMAYLFPFCINLFFELFLMEEGSANVEAGAPLPRKLRASGGRLDSTHRVLIDFNKGSS